MMESGCVCVGGANVGSVLLLLLLNFSLFSMRVESKSEYLWHRRFMF